VPGRLGDHAAAGCLALIRETPTRIVAGMDELLADVSHLPEHDDATGTARDARAAPSGRPKLTRSEAFSMLGSPERSVAGAICEAPCGMDGLVARTGLSPGTVAAALTLLQLRGWIQQMGGTYLPAGALLG
jgi:DNA processing protein